MILLLCIEIAKLRLEGTGMIACSLLYSTVELESFLDMAWLDISSVAHLRLSSIEAFLLVLS